jgi:hypothetical protein
MKSRTRRRIRNWLLATAISLVIIAGSAWSLMITAGIAHRDWWHLMPVMSFSTALALAFWPWAFITLIALAVGVLRELAE